jgi:hypothetical protein
LGYAYGEGRILGGHLSWLPITSRMKIACSAVMYESSA